MIPPSTGYTFSEGTRHPWVPLHPSWEATLRGPLGFKDGHSLKNYRITFKTSKGENV